MQSPETWQAHLAESKTQFKNANHLAYVTLTLLKENRLLVKILTDLHQSAVHLIKAYLIYESAQNKIKLTKDPMKNLNLFIESVAPKYMANEEIVTIIKILKVAKQHKEAPLEFVKRDKFVIFNNGTYETLTADSIKILISILSKAISAFPVKT
ncbi:hypothetical protein KA107_02480 [Candidatus Pacearchaeota archaeon]|nr:hypothetical protein [Candidatus Pacearchaeota archaeon]